MWCTCDVMQLSPCTWVMWQGTWNGMKVMRPYFAVLNRTWLWLQKTEHKHRGTWCVYTARRDRLPCTSDVLWMVEYWTKIWPSKQLKATNDTPDWQFSMYSSFSFWEIARCLTVRMHFTTFRLCKITTANDINGSVRPCSVHQTVCW